MAMMMQTITQPFGTNSFISETTSTWLGVLFVLGWNIYVVIENGVSFCSYVKGLSNFSFADG